MTVEKKQQLYSSINALTHGGGNCRDAFVQTLSHHDDGNETLCQDGTKRVEQFAREASRLSGSFRLPARRTKSAAGERKRYLGDIGVKLI